jgi:hypothetical protein
MEKLNDSMLDVLATRKNISMSEGNPGAMSVIAQILESQPTIGFMTVLGLDDMNIRGSQIWIGYKDYCEQDLARFVTCIQNRDLAMINIINAEGLRGNHEHKAVQGGASSPKQGRELLEKRAI